VLSRIVVPIVLGLPFSAEAATCPMPEKAWTASPLLVSPAPGPPSRKFGMVVHPLLKIMKLHTGVDFDGALGDAIVAAGEGVVVEAGHRGEYGNFILIDHGSGLTTAYAHLASIDVAEGACVEAGQKIAERGNTGLSSGPHLHFGVRRDGAAIDPAPFIRPAQP
jgi:murein DD-endopeptidase MepM/ murein hydrolase activator NlpD